MIDPDKLKDYYKALGIEDNISDDDLSTVESLAKHLDKVLYCSDCKGKGTIWNPKGKDFECDCRTLARARLNKYKERNE